MPDQLEVTIEIHCAACGSANFSMPDSADDSLLTCNDCGAPLGSVATLKAELLAQALAQGAEARRRDLAQLDRDESA